METRIQAIRAAHQRRVLARQQSVYTLGPVVDNPVTVVKSLYARFKAIYRDRSGRLTAGKQFRKAVYRAELRRAQFEVTRVFCG